MSQFLTPLLLLIAALVSVTSVSADNHRFKVGVIAPLSGPLAEYGVSVKNGFELARTEKPELFSNIDLKFEDDQYDGKKSIAAFNKLREVDAVDLVYLWGTGPSQAIAPIAESRNYPLVIMSIDPSPGLDRRWVIRFGNYSEQYILTLLSYLRSNGVKSIGLLRTELGYTNSMVDALHANLLPGESISEIVALQPGDTDLKAAIARLHGKQFDALAIYLMSGQIAQFYREASGRYSAKVSFGTDFFESMSEVRSAGPGMNEAIFPNNAVEPWFAERYQATFGNDNQITFAANAYDFAILAAETFGSKTERHYSPEDILATLRSVQPRLGASGKYSFQESDKGGQYFEFPIVIRKIQGDKIVTVAQNKRLDGSATRREFSGN